MIEFSYSTDFSLSNESYYSDWLLKVIQSYNYVLGDITYLFCDDETLLKYNIEYLNHDTLTDIISFDYTSNNQISGDILISIERVKENSELFNTLFHDELLRVMVHGVLHYCGFKDKTDADKQLMRSAENNAIALFKPFK